MVLIGAGIGLTSAPATESIMGAVSEAKAGIGSAVNDATRILGGTVGVAVVGSIYASLYASRLAQAALPDPLLSGARRSVGAALVSAGRLDQRGSHARRRPTTRRRLERPSFTVSRQRCWWRPRWRCSAESQRQR